ncbi:MAG: tetratricopeptide repeat protein [Spirochaetes bacterium]|nr:tetratricopeptide repeat protein [Spirochaetota bacterium]
MKKYLRVSFSKHYPLLIIVTISLCIIAVSIITIQTISRIYSTSIEYSKKSTIEHIESMSTLIYKFTKESNAPNKSFELIPVKNNTSIYTAYIVTPTDDDRYYKVTNVIKGRPQIRKLTRYDSSEEFLIRRGLAHVTINPVIESQGTISYMESYIPLHGNGKPHCLIVQWLVPDTFILQNKYDALIKSLMQAIAIIILTTIIVIVVVSIIHSYRTKSLIHELSHSIQSIATGTLDIALNDSIDGELKPIATSFNSLVEKIKHNDQMLQNVQENMYADIFKKGVVLLKENKLNEAMACFTVMLMYKPHSFASLFNLGVCYAKKGDLQSARKCFEKSSELNPDNELALRYIEKIKALQ